MPALTIDGTLAAAAVRDAVRSDVAAQIASGERAPGLAVVLVGDDPASRIYTRSKLKAASEAGIRTFERRLAAETTQAELLAVVAALNADDDVDGILVQLPLPAHVDVASVIHTIDPAKDVDGFHPENVGALGIGRPALVPCTPLACVRLARAAVPSLRGCDVTIVGRSTIVGRPVAQLFLLEDATVTIAHSATHDLAAACRRADVLVVAIGRPAFVTAEFVKPGAVVIDVGINRVAAEGDAKGRIVGDVDFPSVAAVAGAITPVPGGVGPMTVALLLENALRCARARRGSPLAPS